MSTRNYCDVVWSNACVNPPGFQVGGLGGGVGDNSDPPRITVTCFECGSYCCPECRVKRKGEWKCLSCEHAAEERRARSMADRPERDEERLDELLPLIRTLWYKNPNQRLGQLLYNTMRTARGVGELSLQQVFNFEDSELIAALTEECERCKEGRCNRCTARNAAGGTCACYEAKCEAASDD